MQKKALRRRAPAHSRGTEQNEMTASIKPADAVQHGSGWSTHYHSTAFLKREPDDSVYFIWPDKNFNVFVRILTRPRGRRSD
jgi:hypothetical protein